MDSESTSDSSFLVNADFIREFERMKRWMENLRINGSGVTFRNGPDGATATISPPAPRRVPPPAALPLVRLGIDDSDTTNGVYASSQIVNWPGTGDADTEAVGTDTTDCIVINVAEYFVTTPEANVQLADLNGTYRAVQIDTDTSDPDNPKPVLVTFAPITRQWTIEVESGLGWSVVSGEVTGSNYTYNVIGQAAGGAAFLTGALPTIPDPAIELNGEPTIGWIDIDYATQTVSLSQTNAAVQYIGCGSS